MMQIPEHRSRLRMQPLTKLANSPKWQLETLRALNEPLFLWFTHGQGRITVAGSARGFHPHNAIFIPAGVMFSFQAMTRVQGMAIYFGSDHGLTLPDTPLHLRLRDGTSQSEVGQIVDAVQRELDGGRRLAERAALCQLGLLSVWLDRHRAAQAKDTTQAGPRNANERLTARYTALLEREFGSAFNISDYAAALGVTPTHLTRACRASCGRTALALLQDRRLYEARRMLSETMVPVQEIARGLGFSTPGYFARAFAQQTGQPPTVWRKAHTSMARH
ncbi:helix-turn-helix transcriptional regulator [Roseinatronobacter alkalisoli]|uniref:AraC family transcriptional regulator n=1 Tax=Roseinatronobacter alkalisoli TaxID=3028235 RepID=A0ABT5T4P0_9RHOB|nr:AraC family transcriptional regulator [Roseinatronobacter sp. HJB301]MDD7970094.1 AraC family transcriptional regulator [Roseinatronobacter sp. HJB301]